MSPDSSPPISGNTRFRLVRKLPARLVAAETVVVDPARRKVFSLNSVGGAVWAAVERGEREAEIVEGVVCRFRVDAERARRDVDGFLRQLEAAALVERAE